MRTLHAMLREGITVREAARRLGVSPRRVQVLARELGWQTEHVGRGLLVDAAAVERRARVEPPAYRSLTAANAWGLLALASADPSLAPALRPMSPWARSRLRGRLRAATLLHLAPLLRKRADVHWLRGDAGDLDTIRAEQGVLPTGVSVAGDYSFDIQAPETVELYASPSTAAALRRTYALEPSARANVLLHVVPSAWPFAEGTLKAPALVAALDLSDSPDPRTRRAGEAYLAAQPRP